jgi:hypothetical protein
MALRQRRMTYCELKMHIVLFSCGLKNAFLRSRKHLTTLLKPHLQVENEYFYKSFKNDSKHHLKPRSIPNSQSFSCLRTFHSVFHFSLNPFSSRPFLRKQEECSTVLWRCPPKTKLQDKREPNTTEQAERPLSNGEEKPCHNKKNLLRKHLSHTLNTCMTPMVVSKPAMYARKDHTKKGEFLFFCILSNLSRSAMKNPGITMSPRPSMLNTYSSAKMLRGNVSLMGASNDLATETITSVPNTYCEKNKRKISKMRERSIFCLLSPRTHRRQTIQPTRLHRSCTTQEKDTRFLAQKRPHPAHC